MNQTTINKALNFSGVGLHSGKTVSCTLRPAIENTGIIFHVKNGSKKADIIPTPQAVTSTGLATTLSSNGVHVATVEHLLAALRGLSIDNIHIDVDGAEVPILDGSAGDYIYEIKKVGIKKQKEARLYYKVARPFKYGNDDRYVLVEPHDSFTVNCTIDFPHPAIGKQEKTFTVTPENFEHIANSRTFCFLKDVEAMHKAGLALGGSLENAIVIDDKVVNNEGLRYKDEFVRHKLLDFVGDMAVLKLPICGKFTTHCSGHGLNNQFARELAASGLLSIHSSNREKVFTEDFMQTVAGVVSPSLAAG